MPTSTSLNADPVEQNDKEMNKYEEEEEKFMEGEGSPFQKMLFNRVLEKITEEKEARLFADFCDSKTNSSSLHNLMNTPNGIYTPKIFFKAMPMTN